MRSRVLSALAALRLGRAYESVRSTGERMDQMAVAVDPEFDDGTLGAVRRGREVDGRRAGGVRPRRAVCFTGARSRTVVCASRMSGRRRSSLRSTRRRRSRRTRSRLASLDHRGSRSTTCTTTRPRLFGPNRPTASVHIHISSRATPCKSGEPRLSTALHAGVLPAIGPVMSRRPAPLHRAQSEVYGHEPTGSGRPAGAVSRAHQPRNHCRSDHGWDPRPRHGVQERDDQGRRAVRGDAVVVGGSRPSDRPRPSRTCLPLLW